MWRRIHAHGSNCKDLTPGVAGPLRRAAHDISLINQAVLPGFPERLRALFLRNT
jgi:hypothetical protein